MWADKTYTQIFVANDLADGDEVLVVSSFDSKSIAMLSTVGGSSPKYMTCSEVTISGSTITLADASPITVWTLCKSGSDYSFKSGTNYVISNSSTSNSANVSTTLDNKAKYTIENLSDGLFQFKNKENTSRFLKGGNGGDRFANYESGASNTRWIKIFKKEKVSWESTSNGIDNITYSTFGFESSGSAAYTDFSGKSINSSAVYAGNAYKASTIDYIQLRASENSGIVSTTSGGKARKVIVTWNSGKGSDGNTIDIYGKSSAYSSAADLFSAEAETLGSKLGSIVRGTSTELIINENYTFIGIRSKSGSCYLDNIYVYWEGDAVSLSDASDYTPTAKDYAKVTLNRSFVEGWNGVILPFDLTTSVKTALGASAVKTLDDATESAGAITLAFEDAALPIAAGTPVLVKLDNALESGYVVLNGVQIKTTAPTTVAKTVAGNTFTLTGTYSEADLEASEVYLVSNNKFYHKDAGVALTAKPFRAYIIQTGASSARVLFNLDGEGETTAIVEVNGGMTVNRNEFFNLAGQKVQNPTKGLYIVNGKKYIVK